MTAKLYYGPLDGEEIEIDEVRAFIRTVDRTNGSVAWYHHYYTDSREVGYVWEKSRVTPTMIGHQPTHLEGEV